MKWFRLLLAALLGILLLPLLALIALAVRIDGGRPVIYSEFRLGRNQQPFRIYKFRTLNTTGEQSFIAPMGDARITRIGRLLRRTHLDELPQLFNIARGDMNFVGPRTERLELWRSVTPEKRARILRFKPGITSPASLKFLCEDALLAKHADAEKLYTQVVFPAKIDMDIDYFEQRSLWTDSLVILRTILAPLYHGRAKCRQHLEALLNSRG